ncbi:MAG TPA: DUF1214 domain-containing protein [Methyloceanibacter sp.]|nr:DUF1214 domain-containing protein [Methyloceanibacter sp.]
MTTALQNPPVLLAPAQSMPWREEEAAHSMRSLAYFIGTFLVALMLGIGSAWYMIERGSPLTTTKVGAWDGWVSEGNPSADPYTKAHVARSGRLPLSSTMARYFTARTDSAGRILTSACQYSIEGLPLNSRWWSLAVYDEYGGLIANPSERYSFNSDELLRHADGSYRVNLSSKARPENWLPSGSEEQHLVLMLRIYSPRETDGSGIGLIPGDRLPKIERVSCE